MNKAIPLYALAAGLLLGPGVPAPAAASEVTITKRECQRLVRHQASADATYRPGVDVRGRKVAPADVDGATPPLRLPNELTVDIGVDLAKRFGLGGGGTQFSSTVDIGKVKFDRRTGQVTFNGQPIGNTGTNAIAQKCREIYGAGR